MSPNRWYHLRGYNYHSEEKQVELLLAMKIREKMIMGPSWCSTRLCGRVLVFAGIATESKTLRIQNDVTNNLKSSKSYYQGKLCCFELQSKPDWMSSARWSSVGRTTWRWFPAGAINFQQMILIILKMRPFVCTVCGWFDHLILQWQDHLFIYMYYVLCTTMSSISKQIFCRAENSLIPGSSIEAR